jgi:hypothetical protein
MKSFDDRYSATNFFSNPADIEAAMDRWVVGGRVWSVNYRGRIKGGFLKRLDPPPPEVWEIRVTEPRPQVRLIGRFAEANTLILTSFHLRDKLDGRGSLAWTTAMKDCDDTWAKLFPGIQLFTRNTIEEYVTENCDAYPI